VLAILLTGIFEALRWDGVRKHMYIPSFMKGGKGVQELLGAINIQTDKHTQISR
jgi:hypothetical protein